MICHEEGLRCGYRLSCTTFINELFQLSSNIILMEHNWARLEWPIPYEEVWLRGDRERLHMKWSS